MANRQVSDYARKAGELVESVEKSKLPVAMELATNFFWLSGELVRMRRELQGQPTTEEYDNGGGQCGTRANPGWGVYAKLLAQLNATAGRLEPMIGGDDAGNDGSDDLASILALHAGGRKAADS